MEKSPQDSYRVFLLASLASGFLCSCGEKEKEADSPDAAEVEEEKVYTYLAEDRFEYENGILKGNYAPPHDEFTGMWRGDVKGSAEVRNGVAAIIAPMRLSCSLDMVPSGRFANYLDENDMIGKDGATIYISFYQALTNIEGERVALIEFVQGDRNVHFFTQFNVGTDTTPPLHLGHSGYGQSGISITSSRLRWN
ncbi:hypothetical protein N9A86_02915 [Akkermansiaceae bacterium]|nr:hypothetical protein [Akkermansiaceae bacterium]